MSVIEVRVPDLGSFKDVSVIELLVKPGDVVELETPLATLETEKATMDVPSSAAGIVKALHVARGGKVNAGDLVATLEASASVAQAAAAAATAVAPQPPAPAPAPVPLSTTWQRRGCPHPQGQGGGRAGCREWIQCPCGRLPPSRSAQQLASALPAHLPPH